jgi:Flp pilus assembly protein TadG
MRRGRSQSGASAVEFAIVLPLLVVLVFGIIEFGLAFGRIQGMQAAAREGARLASLGRDVTAADVQARALASLPPLFADPTSDLVVNVSSASGGGDWCVFDDEEVPMPEVLVRVTVSLSAAASAQYAIAIPFVNTGPANYVAEGVFRCEASR